MNMAETLILLKPLTLESSVYDSLGTFGIENGVINRFEIKMKYCNFASPTTS